MTFQKLIIILLCCLAIACKPQQDGIAGKSVQTRITYPSLPDSIVSTLRSGDIILRKGNGPLSFHLSRATGEAYTHCGIIVKSNEKTGIIHTLGSDASHKGINGVQTQSLRLFVEQTADSCLFICRPIFKPLVGKQIVKAARKYLEAKIPFDYGFSLISQDKFYCSELLYHVFKDVNDNENVFHIIKKNSSHILMFSTFFDETKFTPIFKLKT